MKKVVDGRELVAPLVVTLRWCDTSDGYQTKVTELCGAKRLEIRDRSCTPVTTRLQRLTNEFIGIVMSLDI